LPEPDQRGPTRPTVAAAVAVATAVAAATDPGMQAISPSKQRCRADRGGQDLFSCLDLALLVEVGCDEPLVLVEGVAGGIEDAAAIAHREAWIHAQPQAFQHRRQVPGIDAVAVDGGGAPGRFEPGAIEHRRQQRMEGQRLVEPGDRTGGAGEAGRHGGIGFCPRDRRAKHARRREARPSAAHADAGQPAVG
jgi:hypothetical protein